jgi:hypothetical protein
MKPEFEPIFIRLRAILQKHSGTLTVTEDSPGRYCLALKTHAHPRLKGPMPVAWIQSGKNYMSFHLMPIYGCPKLLDGCSKELKARMQGKSCFNFKAVDDDLFKELEDLTVRGFATFEKSGFGE